MKIIYSEWGSVAYSDTNRWRRTNKCYKLPLDGVNGLIRGCHNVRLTTTEQETAALLPTAHAKLQFTKEQHRKMYCNRRRPLQCRGLCLHLLNPSCSHLIYNPILTVQKMPEKYNRETECYKQGGPNCQQVCFLCRADTLLDVYAHTLTK